MIRLLLLSWYWYFTAILPSVHEGLAHAFGPRYYHACCPATVRRAAWRRLTREGRESRNQAALRFRALQELRGELESST